MKILVVPKEVYNFVEDKSLPQCRFYKILADDDVVPYCIIKYFKEEFKVIRDDTIKHFDLTNEK